MRQLAFIAQGHSDYDDDLRALLDNTGIDPQEFVGLDYFGLLPFFVIAGASVRTQAHHHGEDVHVDGVFVELDEDVVPYEAFRETLSAVLYDAYGDDEQE